MQHRIVHWEADESSSMSCNLQRNECSVLVDEKVLSMHLMFGPCPYSAVGENRRTDAVLTQLERTSDNFNRVSEARSRARTCS